MKAYGVKIIESPDVADIQQMGAKSSTGRPPGNQHGYIRKSKNKSRIRRFWKKAARRLSKQLTKESIGE